jgi:hypothetical protein
VVVAALKIHGRDSAALAEVVSDSDFDCDCDTVRYAIFDLIVD